MKKNKNLAVIIKFPAGDKHYLPVEKNKTGYKAKIIPIKRIVEMKKMGFDPGLMEIELSDIPILEEASMKISIVIAKEFLKSIKNLLKEFKIEESKKKKPFRKGKLMSSFKKDKDKKESE